MVKKNATRQKKGIEQKISLKEQIYNAVIQDIIKGSYQQTDIISEKQLVEKYGVSKSPVREALIELCNENILRSIPRYGYEIIKLTEGDVRNIMEFRSYVEINCLRKAFPTMTEEDLDDLLKYTLKYSKITRKINIWKHWEYNMAFHLKLNSYCHNQYCYNAIQQSMNTLTRAYAQFHWEKWKRTTFEMDSSGHVKLAKLLRERNLEAAILELERDIGSFNEIFV